MLHDNYFEYYENIAHWTFDEYECREECLTDWDLYKILRSLAAPDSHILDLGTAGGEKIFSEFPVCAEILVTDYSPRMIGTARANLAASGRQDVSFEVMDNLKMDVEDEHYDIVVARHTCTDPAQIFRCLKPGGYLLMRGVDKYDCWDLKLAAGYGQGFNAPVPVSVSDYENVLRAGFTDVELVRYTRANTTGTLRLSRHSCASFPSWITCRKLLSWTATSRATLTPEGYASSEGSTVLLPENLFPDMTFLSRSRDVIIQTDNITG